LPVKRSLRWTLITFIFISWPYYASANLGDTLRDCISRYGQPTSHGKGDSTNAGYEWYAFKKGSLNIEETFSGRKLNKIVIIEVFWNEDRSAMSDVEQATILREDSANKKWDKSESQSSKRNDVDEFFTIWKREDGAHASYSSFTKQMTLGAH